MNELLTIAVCTYNRAFFLRCALKSLLHQNISCTKFCVIVVDNASTDDTCNVIKEFKHQFPYFKALYESHQGLSHARNAAIAACTTPWIGYLDDDAKAHPDWISTIIDIIDRDMFDCFGGVYLPWYFYGQLPSWLNEASVTNRGLQAHLGLLNAEKYPSGGNCVYNLSLFRQYGLFPTDFGMRGNVLAYGEETTLIRKFRNGPVRVGFVPHMLIDHCVLKHKYSLCWQIRSRYAQERDGITLNKYLSSNVHFSKTCLRFIWQIIAMPLVFCQLLLLNDLSWQRASIETVQLVVGAAGRLIGLTRYRFQHSIYHGVK